MKLLLKFALFAIAIFLAANALTWNQAARLFTNGLWSSAAAAPSSETIFKQKCTKCHGADGSGDTSMGRIFNAPDFTDAGWWAKHSNSAELISVITKGKKNMPAFGKKLTKAQIASLVTYVQRFKH